MDPFAGARQYDYALVLFVRGALAVAALWGVILAIRSRRHGIRAAFAVTAPEAVVAASLVAVWAFTVAPLVTYLPTDVPQHLPVNLVPVVPLVQGLLNDGWRYDGPNLVGNVLLYAPLGFGLRWRFGLGLPAVLAIAAALSVSVEAWQAVSDQMRSSDVNDVLLNSTGAIAGASCYVLARSAWRRVVVRWAPRRSERGRAAGDPRPKAS